MVEPRSAPARLLILVLLMHGERILGRRDAPLLFTLHDEAGFHPVFRGVFEQLLEAGIAERDGDHPGSRQHALQGKSVVSLPLVLEQFALQKSLVVEIADAVALLHGEQRFLRAVECNNLDTVRPRDVFVVPRAGSGTDWLILEFGPILDAGLL